MELGRQPLLALLHGASATGHENLWSPLHLGYIEWISVYPSAPYSTGVRQGISPIRLSKLDTGPMDGHHEKVQSYAV